MSKTFKAIQIKKKTRESVSDSKLLSRSFCELNARVLIEPLRMAHKSKI